MVVNTVIKSFGALAEAFIFLSFLFLVMPASQDSLSLILFLFVLGILDPWDPDFQRCSPSTVCYPSCYYKYLIQSPSAGATLTSTTPCLAVTIMEDSGNLIVFQSLFIN